MTFCTQWAAKPNARSAEMCLNTIGGRAGLDEMGFSPGGNAQSIYEMVLCIQIPTAALLDDC